MLFPPGSQGALAPAPVPGEVVLDAERLDVFRVAVDFQLLASSLAPCGSSTLRSQLERASVSIVLNIAEGAGRRSPQDKGRFYSIARGSAMECGAILDLLRQRRLAPDAICRMGRQRIIRIVQMLTRLVASTTRWNAD